MGSIPDKATTEDMNEAIGPDVTIPGPYSSGRVSDSGDAGEPESPQSEPTKTTRGEGSLGDLTKEVSTSKAAQETGGVGASERLYSDEERKDK
jgi:hypothetical protein